MYGVFVSFSTVQDNKIMCSRTLSSGASADALCAPTCHLLPQPRSRRRRVPRGRHTCPWGAPRRVGGGRRSRWGGVCPVDRPAAGACPVLCPCAEQQGACRLEARDSGRAAVARGHVSCAVTWAVASLMHGHRAMLGQKRQLSPWEGGVCWLGLAGGGRATRPGGRWPHGRGGTRRDGTPGLPAARHTARRRRIRC